MLTKQRDMWCLKIDMFRVSEEEIINSFQRLGAVGETPELDLDTWMGVFWIAANSQAMQIPRDLEETLSTFGAHIAYKKDLTWFWTSSQLDDMARMAFMPS